MLTCKQSEVWLLLLRYKNKVLATVSVLRYTKSRKFYKVGQNKNKNLSLSKP